MSPVSRLYAGSGGITVVINGAHFTSATGASFNGTAGTGFSAPMDTQIQVTTPTSVTTGPITIYSSKGNYTTSTNFFVPPSVTSFAPTAGRTGTNVVVTGANLLGATAVTINSISASFIPPTNNTTLVVTVPASATTGPIRVYAPAGSSTSSGSFVVQPTVSGFSPNFGWPGTNVIVTGANFNVGTPTVRFNGATSLSVSGVGFSQLTAVVPSGATTGPISVTTTDGSDTNANTFYLPPSISSISPNTTLLGSRVTLTGQNILSVTGVGFNGVPAAGFNVTNNTTVGATAPAGVTTGPVSVSWLGGSVSGATYYAPPVITSFAPTHGLPGTSVTIYGTNLLGATLVEIGATSANTTSVANGQIVFTVPNGAQTAPITVGAPAGTNTSASSFVLDYSSDMTLSVTDAPDPVTAGSNLVYTIVVVNYGPYDAPNGRLTNTLPASTILKSATTTQGSLATGSNPIIGSLDTVRIGVPVTVTLTVVPRAVGSITNTASVGSDYIDPAPANNTSNAVTTVLAPSLAIQNLTNQVKVTWPADIGWWLQAQTNSFHVGISTNSANWHIVPNSSTTNVEVMPIVRTNGSVFYRLLSP